MAEATLSREGLILAVMRLIASSEDKIVGDNWTGDRAYTFSLLREVTEAVDAHGDKGGSGARITGIGD